MKTFSTIQIDKIKPLFNKIKYDGHTIWKASILKEFPKAFRNRFTRKLTSFGIKSGGSAKDEGVYGLSLLRGLAEDLGVKYYGNVFGRVTEARNISRAIETFLKTQKD